MIYGDKICDETRARALDLLWQTAEDPNAPECATGLICLYMLSQDTDTVDPDRLSALLLATAEDASSPLPARTDCFGVCRTHGATRGPRPAHQYLNTYQPAPLKTAAIGVFSLMGTPVDEPLLMPYTRSKTSAYAQLLSMPSKPSASR